MPLMHLKPMVHLLSLRQDQHLLRAQVEGQQYNRVDTHKEGVDMQEEQLVQFLVLNFHTCCQAQVVGQKYHCVTVFASLQYFEGHQEEEPEVGVEEGIGNHKEAWVGLGVQGYTCLNQVGVEEDMQHMEVEQVVPKEPVHQHNSREAAGEEW